MQPAQQTPEQQQAAYQLYQQQMQQYQQQIQQYNLNNPQNQYTAAQQTAAQQPQTGAPTYAPQYAYPPPTQYPQQQYMQQPSYSQQYQPQQYQNRGYQNQPQHSDRVLWVGNLHQDVSDNELREVFQGYGTIENIKLVHTKACAFVTFAEAQAATRAHSEMNHQQIHGQEIKIGWGKTENSQGGFGQQYGGNTGGYDNQQRSRLPDVNKELPQMSPSRALWVGNVTNSITEANLREVFSRCGNVESVRMMVQKNCAFVTYGTVEEATSAKSSLDKFRIADTQIRVNYGKV